jgi:putative alpha-1,2-mannosidase
MQTMVGRAAAAVLLLLVMVTVCDASADVLDKVDVYIGTGGYGFGEGSQVVGAQVPFGLVRLSPESSGRKIPAPLLPFDHYGGYHYHDDHITSFTYTHSVGAGNNFLGFLGIMPFQGVPSTDKKKKHGRFPANTKSIFSHNNETASPGLYSVQLLNSSIGVSLTATGKVGASSFSYQQKKKSEGVRANANANAKQNLDACVLIDVTK